MRLLPSDAVVNISTDIPAPRKRSDRFASAHSYESVFVVRYIVPSATVSDNLTINNRTECTKGHERKAVVSDRANGTIAPIARISEHLQITSTGTLCRGFQLGGHPNWFHPFAHEMRSLDRALL